MGTLRHGFHTGSRGTKLGHPSNPLGSKGALICARAGREVNASP